MAPQWKVIGLLVYNAFTGCIRRRGKANRTHARLFLLSAVRTVSKFVSEFDLETACSQ